MLFFSPVLFRLHVLSHWRRAFVGVQTAGRLLTNCPFEHPPFLQYQILSTKECYWALETFLCPCDETDEDSEVQYQDDLSEVLPTSTETRVRTRCGGDSLLFLIEIYLMCNIMLVSGVQCNDLTFKYIMKWSL